MKTLKIALLILVFAISPSIGIALTDPIDDNQKRLITIYLQDGQSAGISEENGAVYELFNDVYVPTELSKKQADEGIDPTIVRSRYVQVNLEYLKETESVVLNLFDDVSVTVVRERIEERSESQYTWFGRVDGRDLSSVILTIENGDMAGHISLAGKLYHVRPVGYDIHAVRELDQCAFPPEAPSRVPPIDGDPDTSTVPEEQYNAAVPGLQYDDGSIIDVMVVYTDDVARAAANIGAEIQLAIDQTNQTYEESGIFQRLRLVHRAEVNYIETGDYSTDLDAITNGVGVLADVDTWRNRYRADIVNFWVNSMNGACGVAWGPGDLSGGPVPAGYAFSVVKRSCVSNYTFAHELGHNMGAGHDVNAPSHTGAYPYSHGFTWNGWLLLDWLASRSIMAYPNWCNNNLILQCPRIGLWSNPNIQYRVCAWPIGWPCTQYYPFGNNTADNHRTLDYTAVRVSNFRQSQFLDVPSGYWAEDAIYKIFEAGITTGCSQDPLKYCPLRDVNRAQMAVFLLRGINGGNYTPPPAVGIFRDVSVSHWAADWIEQLYNDGITTGCAQGPLRYCPDRTVNRASMAVFLLRSKHGSSYTPPPAVGIFRDVPVSHWAADWIEQLYNEGITTGCQTGPLRYCPDRAVRRDAMAVFLARTFGL